MRSTIALGNVTDDASQASVSSDAPEAWMNCVTAAFVVLPAESRLSQDSTVIGACDSLALLTRPQASWASGAVAESGPARPGAISGELSINLPVTPSAL